MRVLAAVASGLVRRLHAALAAVDPCTAHDDAARVLAETRELYVALDEEGTVLRWNRSAAELFGYPPAHALGRSVEELIIPASHQAAHRAGVEHYLRTGRGRGIGSSVEVEALRADGSLVPVELTIWAQPRPGGTVFHALGHDLTPRRERDRALALVAEHRQALLLSDSSAGVRDVLCRTVRDAARCQGVYLYEPDDGGGRRFRLTGQALGLAEPGRPTVELEQALLTVLQGPAGAQVRFTREQLTDSSAADAVRATGLQSFVVRPLRRDDRLVGVLLLGWLAGRVPSGDEQLLDLLATEALALFDRLAVQEQLHLAARTDPLTEAWNRREYGVRLAEAVAQAERDGAPLSLVALDLDRFKAYNDAHGHPAGDALLAEAARRWQAEVPGEGLARTGGDEFALLLPGADAHAAGEVARVLRAVTPPPVGLTTGVVERARGESAEQLLQRADAALYAGKRAR